MTETSQNGRPLLSVDDLVVRYRLARGLSGTILRRPVQHVHAVSGVSLTVARGEMVALVGESGCGKTTTAQAILRLVEADSGGVSFDGVDVTSLAQRDMRALRRRMQIIYQDPYESLDPRFRVSATVAEPLVIHGIGSRAERRDKVASALEQVGLAPCRALRGPVPTRALGRAAPACRDCGEPRPRSRPARRGRARVDARRLRPRRHPRDPRRAA